MDLVILAAGMGSRFGGLKQAEGVDKDGNFIIDYSIFDALKAGFENIVLIIKKENLSLFRQTLDTRVKHRKIKYVFQTNEILQQNNIERTKPLGTGHALLCARDAVKDNFCIINADDFYGYKSFKLCYDFLKKANKNSLAFGMIGYKLENTLSENGAVKRGVCNVSNGFVKDIVESTIEKKGETIEISPLDVTKKIDYHQNMMVSMNMICLTPQIFKYLEKGFQEFCKDKQSLQSKEFLLPELIGTLTKQNLATLKIIPTEEKWFGITYREDLKTVQDSLQVLKQNRVYPEKLWQ